MEARNLVEGTNLGRDNVVVSIFGCLYALKTLVFGCLTTPGSHRTLVALRRYTQKPTPAAADDMRALPNVVSDRPECL